MLDRLVVGRPVGQGWTPPGLVCVKAETAFSAVSAITVDSIFTSSYTDYEIHVTFTQSTGSALYLRLRVAAVAAATNYNFVRTYASSASISATTTASATSFTMCGNYSAIRSSAICTLFSPQLAAATSIEARNNGNSAAATAPEWDNYSGNHSTATAYDGFSITPSAGTITGFYSVYGYSKTA